MLSKIYTIKKDLYFTVTNEGGQIKLCLDADHAAAAGKAAQKTGKATIEAINGYGVILLGNQAKENELVFVGSKASKAECNAYMLHKEAIHDAMGKLGQLPQAYDSMLSLMCGVKLSLYAASVQLSNGKIDATAYAAKVAQLTSRLHIGIMA